MIKGVAVKKLVTHTDDRGFFREIIRVTDEFFEEGFAQWSHSLMLDGVIKAWHYHRVQRDNFCCTHGKIRIGLYDAREGSSTFGKTMDVISSPDDPKLVSIYSLLLFSSSTYILSHEWREMSRTFFHSLHFFSKPSQLFDISTLASGVLVRNRQVVEYSCISRT